LAVKKYLEEIAEPDADKTLTVFKEIRREIKREVRGRNLQLVVGSNPTAIKYMLT